MKDRWVLRVGRRDAPAAAVLRACPGVEVCALPEALWLRGPCDGGPVERTSWLVPGERFRLTDASRLIPWRCRLPVMDCPAGPWVPCAEFIQPVATAAALPGELRERVSVRLVRSGPPQPAALLLLSGPVWVDYVNTAPGIRLSRLHFALNAAGSVLVRGHPLPAVPGTLFTVSAGIAVPCGWTWTPAVPPRVLAEALSVVGGDMALFAADGSYEMVPATAWVPVSRSGVRISLEGVSP